MQIITLQLWSADVPALRGFYERLLPGAAEVATDETLRLRVGQSQLIFKRAAGGWLGQYHFALRLPPQHLAAAKAHVAGVTTPLRDAAGNDQFAFENWGANAFYWRDPAGNIGELIAHGRAAPSEAPFDTAMLAGVAEAGIAAADPVALASDLRRALGIDTYHDSSDDFVPLGDDVARLILVRSGRIWYPNTGVVATPLPTTVQLRRDDGAAFRVRCTTNGCSVTQLAADAR